MAINAKQKMFGDEYLIDLNATRAADRAGYKNPNKQGPRLLVNVGVAAYIEARMEDRSKRTEITQDRVLEELAKIGFANMLDYVGISQDGDAFIDLSSLDRETAAAIGEITVEDYKDGRGDDARDVKRVKFKLLDKKGALVDIGRHLKMFTDKVEFSGEMAVRNLTDAELEGQLAELLDKGGTSNTADG